MTFPDLIHKFFTFLWDNKQKFSATAMAVLSVLQLSPDLADLLSPQTYKLTMLGISVLMVVFASMGNSSPINPVPPSQRLPSVLLMLAAGLLASTLLGGCAALGIEKPQSFDEKLAGGYAAVAATRDSATTLLTAGKISVDDAKNLQAQADTARAGLDITRQIHATDPTAAENRLQAILVGLTALETYLRSKN